MFSSNLTKFFAALALVFTFFSGCGWWRETPAANSSETAAVSDDLKSEIPFSTKEPEEFQAEIVVTTGDTERRTFIARRGAERRLDFNFGAANQLTALATDKNYLLYPARKIYAENAAHGEAGATDEWTSFLTTEWLSGKTAARFEKLETAGNLTRYRVSLEAGEASEIFVYFDETLRLPVRQEFYSTRGEQRALTYAFELKNLKLETETQIFSVPADYQKVSAEEFREILRGGKQR